MYNSEEFIERCLQSLLTQGIAHDEYEIIVFNDGSTDNSVIIVESFSKKHNNIRLYSDANAGAYSTRNKLLKLAKGKYIYNVDADDYIVQNSLGLLLDFAFENDLDFIGFKTRLTDTIYHSDVTEEFKDLQIPKIHSGLHFLVDHPNHRIEIWWYFIRKSFLEDLGLVFEKNEYNADVVFTLKLLLHAQRLAYFPIEVYHYYQSPNSIMRNNDKARKVLYVKYFSSMIVDFSLLINKLKLESFSYKEEILTNFTKRRDAFVFFLIVRMLKIPMTNVDFNSKLKVLKEVNAYPIINRVKASKHVLLNGVLRFIMNRKALLIPIAGIYKIINNGK